MSGLSFHLTPEGRALLVNAANTGTNAILVTQIGVSASGAGMVGGVLSGEIKRLATFAGEVVAADTVHVTIRDESADVYSLRAFALYEQGGTLLGWYAQADVILEKAAQAMLLLSTDIAFADLDATTLTFGDSNWTNPPATTERQGVVELATGAETTTGTDGSLAVTPAALKSALDSRFGVGAPSAVVKGLLALATAAAIRAGIGLGSASLRDEGAGKGLDADLLDGQHGAYYLAWENLSGRPTAFPPSAHRHDFAALDNVPSTATRWPTWLEVSGKPAQYPPSLHTHAAEDITSGTFALERIPALPFSKTSGLEAALEARAILGTTVRFQAVGVGPDSDVLLYEEANGRAVLRTGNAADGYRYTVINGNGSLVAAGAVIATSGGPSALNANNCGHVFQTDTDSGMFSPGDGTVVIAANGVAKVTVTTTATTFSTAVTMPSLNATSSDKRLKREIKDIRDCLSLVRSLRPRRWRWKATGEPDFGFIAQEHRKVLPEAVYEDDEGMLFVRYGKAEALLVGAVQEIAARLDRLEAAILPNGVR